MTSDRRFVVLGCGLALLAVAAGAFGAHAIQDRISPEFLDTFETGARYHMYHALALVAVGLAFARWPAPAIQAAGWLFVTGTVIFSGSLYGLALTGIRWLGAVTPVGGLCFLMGWAGLGWGVWRGIRDPAVDRRDGRDSDDPPRRRAG